MYLMAILFGLALYLDLMNAEEYLDDDYNELPGPLNFYQVSNNLKGEAVKAKKAMCATVSNFADNKEAWSFENAQAAHRHIFKLFK